MRHYFEKCFTHKVHCSLGVDSCLSQWNFFKRFDGICFSFFSVLHHQYWSFLMFLCLLSRYMTSAHNLQGFWKSLSLMFTLIFMYGRHLHECSDCGSIKVFLASVICPFSETYIFENSTLYKLKKWDIELAFKEPEKGVFTFNKFSLIWVIRFKFFWHHHIKNYQKEFSSW